MSFAEIIVERAKQHNPRAADPWPTGLVIPDLAMTENHPMGGLRLRINPFLVWTRDMIGYAPILRAVRGDDEDQSLLCAMFRDSTDAELFRLAFIEWWKR